MSNTNLLGSEEWAVIATIDPDAITANTYYTDDIDMSLFEQIIAILMVGNGAESTIDFSLVSGTAATPTTAVSGKSITQLVNSPTGTHDDKQYVINLRGDELTEGHRYVRAKFVNDATVDGSAIVLGKAKSLPASDNDLASVAEIVA